MTETDSPIQQQLSRMAGRLQEQRTGLAPKSVTVVLTEDTLVVPLNDVLTLAEKALARNPEGAAQVQEFHRQLFFGESKSMDREIKTVFPMPIELLNAFVKDTSQNGKSKRSKPSSATKISLPLEPVLPTSTKR
jgi:uncharacterized protein YbcI